MTDIKYYFTCVFFLCALNSFGQHTDTLTIYYPINHFNLQTGAQRQLSNAIRAPNIKTIQVLGYADYLSTTGYNLSLSAKRAEAVRSFLMKKTDSILISAQGKGQLDAVVSNKKGDPKARKVEIVIDYKALTVAPTIIAVDTIKKVQPIVNVIPPQNDVTTDIHAFEGKIDSLFNGEAGTSITLNELNFIGGRHMLTPKSNLYLPVLLKYLLKYSDIKIKILGHICCVYDGKDGYDYDSKTRELSKNRAKAIYDYLIEHGVSRSRMNYKGLGSSQPKVFPELTNEDSELNRRVEISIVK